MSTDASASPLAAKVAQAETFVTEERYEEAIAILEPVLEQQSMHAHALHAYCACLIALERYHDCTTPALRLAVVEPNVPEARYFAALALYKDGRYRESIEHFEAVMHLRPTFRDTRDLLFEALLRYGHTLEQNEPKTSELYYRRAMELRPDRHEPVLLVLQLLHRIKEDANLGHLITVLPSSIVEHPQVKSLIEELDHDPTVHSVLHQSHETPVSIDDPRGSVKVLGTGSVVPPRNYKDMLEELAASLSTGGIVCLLLGVLTAGLGMMVMNGGGSQSTMHGIAAIVFGLGTAGVGGWLLKRANDN